MAIDKPVAQRIDRMADWLDPEGRALAVRALVRAELAAAEAQRKSASPERRVRISYHRGEVDKALAALLLRMADMRGVMR